jgi:hypothetical protein
MNHFLWSSQVSGQYQYIDENIDILVVLNTESHTQQARMPNHFDTS